MKKIASKIDHGLVAKRKHTVAHKQSKPFRGVSATVQNLSEVSPHFTPQQIEARVNKWIEKLKATENE